ncbi:MAG TPA: beta-galactosidase [Bacteroidia bacterium]|nr:beta-galactosidase [Bacteroidia bacterium]
MKKLLLFALLIVSQLTQAQTGIWCWAQWREAVPLSIYQNKNITGVSLAFYWQDMEPQPGRYDFTRLNTELSKCVAHNKKAGISVAAGAKAPQWLKDKTPCLQFSEIRKDGDGKPYEVILPIPWDTTYLNAWQRFINALGAHIAARPTYNNIITHVALSGISTTTCEMRLPQMEPTPQHPNVTNATVIWRNAGYDGFKILQSFNFCRRAWIKAFPQKKLVIDMMLGNEFPLVDTVNINQGVFKACNATGNPGRYIFKHTSLTNNSRGTLITEIKNQGFAAAWQTNQSMYGATPCAPACNDTSIKQALDIGIKFNVQFIEMQTLAIINYPQAVSYAAIKMARMQ